MFRKSLFAPLLAASAMALTVTPAYAGKADRAREAIAAAEAKIHTAEQMGAATEMPERNAEARALLAKARENLRASNKSTSIDEAIRAQAVADATIGEMQRRRNVAVSDAQNMANENVAVAQQQAANAQDQAADANARAAAAERSAAASAAEAQAARIAAQTPAQVETTVTTQQPAPRASTARTTTRKVTTRRTTARAVPPAAVTTTTTVKQAVN